MVVANPDGWSSYYSGTTQNFQDIFCQEPPRPYWVCRETCNNCRVEPTATPTVAPTPSPIVETVPPSAAPTRPSIRQMVLLGAPMSTLAALEEQNSPQSRALEWLLEEEETVSVLPEWRIQQLFAVATLAYSTNLAGGGGGGGAQRWLNNYNECTYNGIFCDDSGNIAQIDIADRSRGGQLPEEVSMFSYLVIFNGSGNRYTGPIPEGFGFLPYLITLQLDQNALTGNLPETFINLSGSLRNLFVNSNDLSGEFPNFILSRLPLLQSFSAFGNDFTGEIADEVCELPALSTLITDCDNPGCYTRCVD